MARYGKAKVLLSPSPPLSLSLSLSLVNSLYTFYLPTPFLNHVTVGFGWPLALQNILRVSPSGTAVVLLSEMSGGTENESH